MVLSTAIASLINSLIGMMPTRTIVMLITKQSAAAMGLSAGSPICVSFKAAAVHDGEFLYRMSFDLSSMEQEELCHDRCTGLLLSEYMQDMGAAEPNAKTRVHKPCN